MFSISFLLSLILGTYSQLFIFIFLLYLLCSIHFILIVEMSFLSFFLKSLEDKFLLCLEEFLLQLYRPFLVSYCPRSLRPRVVDGWLTCPMYLHYDDRFVTCETFLNENKWRQDIGAFFSTCIILSKKIESKKMNFLVLTFGHKHHMISRWELTFFHIVFLEMMEIS